MKYLIILLIFICSCSEKDELSQDEKLKDLIITNVKKPTSIFIDKEDVIVDKITFSKLNPIIQYINSKGLSTFSWPLDSSSKPVQNELSSKLFKHLRTLEAQGKAVLTLGVIKE